MFKIIVITAFRPCKVNMENISRLALFADFICIVDNTPLNHNGFLKIEEYFHSHFVVLSNFNHGGLSGAFNLSRSLLSHLSDMGEIPSGSIVMMLDQDTNINAEVFNELCNLLLKENKPSAIGAIFSDKNRVSSDGYLIEKSCLPSSTTTVMLSDFVASPYHDIRFPIDLADFVWCWEASYKTGMVFYQHTGVEVDQKLGVGVFNFLGRRVTYPSPIRHMYQVEASLRLWKVKHAPIKAKLRFTLSCVFKVIFYPFLLPDGRKRALFMGYGLVQFFLKKL